MSHTSNLPDDFSWAAFDRYFGDDREPEPECCDACGASADLDCEPTCDCNGCIARFGQVAERLMKQGRCSECAEPVLGKTFVLTAGGYLCAECL